MIYTISIDLVDNIVGSLHRIWCADADDLAEAERLVAAPPLSIEALVRLRRGTFITARYDSDELKKQDGSPCQRVAAFGRVMAIGSGQKPPRIVVCKNDGIFLDGKPVADKAIGLRVFNSFLKDTGLDQYSRRSGSDSVSQEWTSELGFYTLALAAWALRFECKQLVYAAVHPVAMLAMPFVPDGFPEPREAVDAALGWAHGEVTTDDLKLTGKAARDLRERTAYGGDLHDLSWAAINAIIVGAIAGAGSQKIVLMVPRIIAAAANQQEQGSDISLVKKIARIVRSVVNFPEVAFGLLRARTKP